MLKGLFICVFWKIVDDAMTRLATHSDFIIRPLPPYDFRLTVRKPAGWSLFNPFEVYERETLWTATHLCGDLVGIRLRSTGTVGRPSIYVRVFPGRDLTRSAWLRRRGSLAGCSERIRISQGFMDSPGRSRYSGT